MSVPATRYWLVPSTGELVEAEAQPSPGALELTPTQWNDLHISFIPRAPLLTHLFGGALSHTTDAKATSVTIMVISPRGEVVSERPTVNGVPTVTLAPLVLKAPGAVTVETLAVSNDVLIIEEFS